MTIINVPRSLSDEEAEDEAMGRFDGGSYYSKRRVSAGFAFFTSRDDQEAYEAEVLKEAKAIRAAKRPPEVADALRRRNQANGAKSAGRPKAAKP